MPARVRMEDRKCPLSTAMPYVGEWWTILILHHSFDGYTRFDQFQANNGLSSSMLTARLKTLVDNAILGKRPYLDKPVRHEYVLTNLGWTLRPVLVAMAAWRNAQLPPDQRAMILVDSKTGREVEPALIGPGTGWRVEDPRFVFTAGHAAGPEMPARYDGGGTAQPNSNGPDGAMRLH